jgi:hypothetical protein
VSLLSFEIDPLKVLGVTANASLEQIRDAYRQKAKRYHPDAGGEDWAFRILVQAYELLCSARVVRATHVESPPRTAHAHTHTHASRAPKPEPSSETVHVGIHDANVDPARMVAVEHLCVRYLWDDVNYLWLGQGVPEEERFLSCSLNFSWPDRQQSSLATPIPDRAAILDALGDVFDELIISTRVVSSKSRIEDDKFAGWLSYTGFDRSWKSLTTLHLALRARGLGMRHWSRDLFIPRAWR